MTTATGNVTPALETQRAQLRAAVSLAARVVPTHYPLETFIAVNPLAGLEGMPFEQAIRRAGDLFGVLESAASIDSELVELAQMTEGRRRTGAGSVIESVLSVGRIRPGLDVERATDLLWMLNGSAVFRHLVRRAGWSPDEYQQWLATAMVEQLLDPAVND